MIKVLFVCLGNICRSPMAEAVFNDMLNKSGLRQHIEADSAGTGNWHVGKPPHEGTRALLAEKRISCEGLYARQLMANDLEVFDYIIAMDAENEGNIRRMAGFAEKPAIRRLLDFVDDSKTKDVPDPYYTGNFDEVYELVAEGCRQLLNEIKKEHNL
ncbi:protein tyrosine phosphatase [Bacillus glycinifermentans]|uniref:protein-tyrosine-phosphatase n=1 Tax=Bacillus glycinifermentans TaxID=1664069 RepID=A0A0J6EMP8_9BACI|nr:low molecular weight protein-tyrosine-phosphatase [Bacillus glycinifermentans]ATH94730.1 low molecular weight phosphotyrosine protein phosphatase [Bacillus glycinifermentans]KMM58883.1 protein tyrosine phosphatase [Bacillus glycinifermentans]KRT92012.1 protein tyrosine phosphatase [Bacillus glycinifermentans]MEC0486453.1 low molecular weight phosphotyrosine protein phosphatase [Bacillus glycinifermentans]MEC0494103.1 low molecular weight phosphotyrosine protein phosphatase [Bacillus glycini